MKYRTIGRPVYPAFLVRSPRWGVTVVATGLDDRQLHSGSLHRVERRLIELCRNASLLRVRMHREQYHLARRALQLVGDEPDGATIELRDQDMRLECCTSLGALKC